MSEMETKSPLGWEQLVTDGHVRAARVRRIQPVLVTLAIALMVVGWTLMGAANRFQSGGSSARQEALSTVVQQRQWRAIDAFAGMPAPRVGKSQIKTLPLAATLTTTQSRIITELNRAGEVPEDLHLREVEPSEFWRVPWKPGELITTHSGSVRIVGGLINRGSAEYGDVARWLGVFSRQSGEWKGLSIIAPGFFAVEGLPTASIASIPVTLEPILRTKK